jgi:hypothetical protein
MAPILQPYLVLADSINFAGRESADQPLSTRVSRSTEDEFLQIVSSLAEGHRPGLTSSALLRELVEDYVAQQRTNRSTIAVASPQATQAAPTPLPSLDTEALLTCWTPSAFNSNTTV